MTPERVADLRIDALNAKYAGKEFTIPASETMEILDLAMSQLEPRVTPEMWKNLGRIEALAERTTSPVSDLSDPIKDALRLASKILDQENFITSAQVLSDFLAAAAPHAQAPVAELGIPEADAVFADYPNGTRYLVLEPNELDPDLCEQHGGAPKYTGLYSLNKIAGVRIGEPAGTSRPETGHPAAQPQPVAEQGERATAAEAKLEELQMEVETMLNDAVFFMSTIELHALDGVALGERLKELLYQSQADESGLPG